MQLMYIFKQLLFNRPCKSIFSIVSRDYFMGTMALMKADPPGVLGLISTGQAEACHRHTILIQISPNIYKYMQLYRRRPQN